MKKIVLTIILICSFGVNAANGQSGSSSKYLAFSASYMELKDQLNHGFVFAGPDVEFEYGSRKIDSQLFSQWSVALSGGGKTALGSWGFRWGISPFQMNRSFNIHHSKSLTVYCGPDFSINYNLQNYPDMHTGDFSWMTNFRLGAHFAAVTELRGKKLIIQSTTSVLSVTSRPEVNRDPHYFSLNAGEIISDMHSNMSFSPLNDFFYTELSFELMMSLQSSLSLSFDYQNYSGELQYRQMNYALTYRYYFDSMEW